MPAGIQLPERCAARFLAVRLLASGGFGMAILAEQVSLKRLAVIKIMTAAAPDADDRARFRHEAKITASLNHPGIVQVLDHDIDGDVPWIAYEYLQGETLADQLARGPLEAPAIVELGREVGAALAAAHERGVAHRDVKPGNLVRGPAGWTLIDFGIAKWSAGSSVNTAAGMIFGTPEYIPPEYIRGEPFGPAGDVYALGAVLYQCATGAPPFSGPTPLDTLRLHVDAAVPSLRGWVPAGLAGVIERALAKAPADRPAGAAGLVAELAALQAAPGRTRVLSRADARAPAAPPARRWPLALFALVPVVAYMMMGRAAAPVAAPVVRFETGRRVAVVVVPPVAHARAAVVRAAGRGAITTTVPAGAGEVRVGNLDAGTAYTVEVPDCPTVNLRTPPFLAVWRPLVYSADTAALIDFNFDGPADPEVVVRPGRRPRAGAHGERRARSALVPRRGARARPARRLPARRAARRRVRRPARVPVPRRGARQPRGSPAGE